MAAKSASSKSDPSNARRKLSSSWRVNLADTIARNVVTIGGLATIGAVLLVVLVLLGNVLPLFRGTKLDADANVVSLPAEVQKSIAADSLSVLHCGVDEFVEIAWFLMSDGQVVSVSTGDAKTLDRFAADGSKLSSDTKTDVATSQITASFRSRDGDEIFLGRDNGTLQRLQIGFETSFLKLDEMDESIRSQLLDDGSAVAVGDSTYRKLAGRLVRRQQLSQIVASEPEQIAETGEAIRMIFASLPRVLSSFDASTETAFAALSDSRILAGKIDSSINRFTGAAKLQWHYNAAELSKSSRAIGLNINPLGNVLTQCDEAGLLTRWSLASDEIPKLINQQNLKLPNGGNGNNGGQLSNVSVAATLLGGNTLLLGTDAGKLVGAFPVQQGSGESGERIDAFVAGHNIAVSSSKIKLIASSAAARLVATVDATNMLVLTFVPTDSILTSIKLPSKKPPQEIWFSSKQDRVGVLAGNELNLHNLSVGHPEASWSAFFKPLWYEGYSEPVSIWQSSSAGVDAEAKLSMLPLIFGTFKATFYSLLIAVPLSLMAAVYSSEFLSRPVRSRIKPAIELMAGIPSVVLGFIAALVLASVFQTHLFAILLSFFTLIFTLALVGNMWLMMPQQVYLRLERYRTLLLCFIVPFGLWLAWFIAPPLERFLFKVSLVWWLDAKADSSAWPGWLLLLMPISMLVVTYVSSTVIASVLRPMARRWNARPFAALMLGRYLISCVAMVALAAAIAWLLTAAGFDLRNSVFGTYQERNALLVGAILGFAIIPIIYTIAEDALQAVPQHLRSASLGCGATAWQTTTRIVLPTAMSGLFGGLMIGFGRAVGETMVVLMAAGNTPVMDVNPFNGYRTLSATLATELPEAARGSTHFHTLFLAALLLFCFTLVANTAAEFIRMRFRKRSFHL